jgi:hypothetical protein
VVLNPSGVCILHATCLQRAAHDPPPPLLCRAQVLCQELCVAEEAVGSDRALLNVSLLLASSRHQDFAAGDLQPAKAYAAWLVAGLATDDYYR